MKTPILYRVEKDRLDDLVALFTESFQNDPLYVKLMPDETLRAKVLPKYFHYYLDMYFGHAQIYADGPDLQGAVVLLDQNEVREEDSPLHNLKNGWFTVKLFAALLHLDPTGHTAWSFVKNRQFLTSKWANFVGGQRMHIDFLAVSPRSQHKGIGGKLLQNVLAYADAQHCHTTLETHNPTNVEMYHHFGFQLVEEIGSKQDLCQYCLER